MTELPHTDLPRKPSHRARTIVFIVELIFIAALLAAWLASRSVQSSSSLLVLFFYSFPSEFLVGLLPHEPILIYFGKLYPALTVALISVVSTVMAEAINYSAFGYVCSTETFQRMMQRGTVRKIIKLFHRAPFTAIWIAGFTPVPFYPIRFLVVMGRYPVGKYLAGVFLSRAPRFYILAKIGDLFQISGMTIFLFFAILLLLINLPVISRVIKKSGPMLFGKSDVSDISS